MSTHSEPENGWISVSERFPEGEQGHVLTINDCGVQQIAQWIENRTWLFSSLTTEAQSHELADSLRLKRIYVTHWQPLPPSPFIERKPL